MEILHEEINNWILVDVFIGLLFIFLLCTLTLLFAEGKIVKTVLCLIVIALISTFLIFQNHEEKVIIIEVNDWNEYYEFMKTKEWSVMEENGRIIKLNKYY